MQLFGAGSPTRRVGEERLLEGLLAGKTRCCGRGGDKGRP